MLQVLAAGLVFGSLWSALTAWQQMRHRHHQLMDQWGRTEEDQEKLDLETELRGSLGKRVIIPFLHWLLRPLAANLPVSRVERYQARLEQAGSPWPMTAGEYLALRDGLLLLGGTLGMVGGSLLARGMGTILALALAGLLLAWLATDGHLSSLARRRREAARRELPDVMDLVTVCLEAGLGLDGAWQKVVQEKSGVLSQEFARLLREVQMGRERADAMRHLAMRVDLPEVQSWSTAVIQAEELGLGLARVMRQFSFNLRLKRRQQVAEAAAQAPVKMLIPLVFCIFPAVFIVILGPAVVRIVTILLAP